MKAFGKIMFCVGLNLAASSNVLLAGSRLQIRDTMRTIERLQDATTLGDTESFLLMSKLMLQMESDIVHATPQQLRDVQNVRSVTAYLLSGGNPIVVQRVYVNVKIDPELSDLFWGSIAYAHGEKEKAISLLGEINASSLPATIAGRLALIQGILVADTDSKKAVLQFEQASAMMPGTIVDEGALRRCSNLSAKLKDLERFENCSSRMFRAYSASIYWRDFLSSFVSFAATVQSPKNTFYLNWLLPLLDERPAELEVKVMLEISGIAARNGNFELAILCGSRASQLATANSNEQNRAILYSGSALLGIKMEELAMARLHLVDATKLEIEDRILFNQAKDVVHQLGGENTGIHLTSGINKSGDAQTADTSFEDIVARSMAALKNVSIDNLATAP